MTVTFLVRKTLSDRQAVEHCSSVERQFGAARHSWLLEYLLVLLIVHSTMYIRDVEEVARIC